MTIAPLAVLPLAVVAATLGWLAGRTGWPSLLAGLVVVAVLALGTRALHLDGLADTVDGLGSGRDRERSLEIMRRGDVGPMGVIALVLVLGGQAAAASILVADLEKAALLAVLIAASRTALLVGCRVGVPAARAGGLGSAVAGSVTTLVLVGGWALAGAVVTVLVMLAGVAWWIGLLTTVLGAAVAYGVVRIAVRRLGGITGDVLGACVELTLLALLLSATVV